MRHTIAGNSHLFPEIPDASGAVASWRRRLLDWIYPARRLGGRPPERQESWPNLVPAPRPSPGRPAGFRTGGAR